MAEIEIRGLEKSYGKNRVLKGIDLDINSGEITAILGPNASGKTTLLKCILGLVIPSRGEIKVKGKNVSEGYDYKRFIGYMPQEPSFPENLTPEELIGLISNIRGAYPKESIERLAELFRVKDFFRKQIRSLSGGTKQKVSAIIALAFNPDILILDEPTVGLDPVSSSKLKEEITGKKKEGKTVLLTSHIMSEVEELADRVVLLIEGSMKIDSSVQKLKEETGESKLERAIAKLMEEGLG